jgi:predicted ATPase/DNA-binding winged helix-turn-helix (wHTH) protein
LATLSYRFGSFELHPAQRRLLADGRSTRVGSRALEILTMLVEHAGQVVSNEALMARVWPHSVVEDSNLRVHIAALRKLLGDGGRDARFIGNAPLRGYSFIAPVEVLQAAPAAAGSPPPPQEQHAQSLPVRLTRMVGREDPLRTLLDVLPTRRFVTLIGPGGVGKTTLAIAAAERFAEHHAQAVHFVDLGALADPALVPSAVAAALGLAMRDADPTPQIVQHLQARQLLLLLDNCEHVVARAALLAEAILGGAPGVHLLATSREPLRAGGEWLQRLAPLSLAPLDPALTRAQALGYEAPALFMERAGALQQGLEFQDQDMPFVASICRRLDGIPLAIELAAGRLAGFGLQMLAALLDDHLSLLGGGRRTALPRHQTLQATLDWSHSLLSMAERQVLRRLSVFSAHFTLASAQAVAADPGREALLLPVLSELVDKSLVMVDVSGEDARYRLLQTTRDHARQQLADAPQEQQAVHRRHAADLLVLLRQAGREWSDKPDAAWLDRYGRRIDDLRAALDWSLCGTGDLPLGQQLLAASAVLWFRLSLMAEFRQRAERVLALEAPPGTASDPRVALETRVALCHALAYLEGPSSRVHIDHCASTLALARALGDTAQQMQVLYRLWHSHLALGHFQDTLATAREYAAVCDQAGAPSDHLLKHRLLAIGHHSAGELGAAQRHLDRLLAHPDVAANRLKRNPLALDETILALCFRAQFLWLQGCADQAWEAATYTWEESVRRGHMLSMLYALAFAPCAVGFWCGRVDAVGEHAAIMRTQAAQQTLALWHGWARCYELALAARAAAPGIDALHHFALDDAVGLNPTQFDMLATFGPGLAAPATVQRILADDRAWVAPEVLRGRALQTLAQGGPQAPAQAQRLLQQALATARRQASLAWELRTATTLARLWHGEGRSAEARALLEPVHAQFKEGFSTQDLQRARTVLDML